MREYYVIEGKFLVRVVEYDNGRMEKEIIAIGDPERWAKELGVELKSEEKEKVAEEKKDEEKVEEPKKRSRRGRKKKADKE